MARPPWYHFLTIAGTLAVVIRALTGGKPGLAAQAGTVRWPEASHGSERPARGATASISTTAS